MTTWTQIYAELSELLSDVEGVDEVIGIPAATMPPIDDSVTVSIVPPARSSERGPGRLETTLTVSIVAASQLNTADQSTADSLHAVVERIDAKLDTAITLNGLVTSTSPVEWDEAATLEAVPESGRWYIAQRGQMAATIITNADNRGA